MKKYICLKIYDYALNNILISSQQYPYIIIPERTYKITTNYS